MASRSSSFERKLAVFNYRRNYRAPGSIGARCLGPTPLFVEPDIESEEWIANDMYSEATQTEPDAVDKYSEATVQTEPDAVEKYSEATQTDAPKSSSCACLCVDFFVRLVGFAILALAGFYILFVAGAGSWTSDEDLLALPSPEATSSVCYNCLEAPWVEMTIA